MKVRSEMFRNEPLTSFSLQENRDSMHRAIEASISSKLHSAPIIGGKEIATSIVIKSLDPSSPSHSVGDLHLASSEDVASALKILKAVQPSWGASPHSERANIIREAGKIIRREKFRLAALIVREAGKPWHEADGDVAEAIDFCLYYASEMERLGVPISTDLIPGETNELFYDAKGISVVISPWNFPLAIACGMTVASLVTGNATILKPAEQTGIIAYEFAKILLEAGVPKDVFAYIPGKGQVIGRLMIESPDVDLICFTGSKEVGLEIIKKAGETHPGQRNVKKVVAEMGGKNAVIVDEDADLDEVTKAIIESSFGYAGQKCSACSRLIVVGSLYEKLLSRLRDAASDVIVGPASDPATFLPPVIDKKSKDRILEIIERAEKEHDLLVKGPVPKGEGFFVPITIFRDVDPGSFLWREEVFGPVLACRKAGSFDEAIQLANDSEYALTGGVFSRNPKNIETAKKKFKVGNLYINRKCTGALVRRQPFGGSKMSGVGSKAGGPDYLLHFLDPRVLTENTSRRGFVPEG